MWVDEPRQQSRLPPAAEHDARRDPRGAQPQHLLRNADRVRMANIAQMVNVLQAMILTDGPKMVLTPTYWVHKMYVPIQDATWYRWTFDRAVPPRRYSLPVSTRPRFATPRVSCGSRSSISMQMGRHAITTTFGRPERPSASGHILTAACSRCAQHPLASPKEVAPKPYRGRLAGQSRFSSTFPPNPSRWSRSGKVTVFVSADAGSF